MRPLILASASPQRRRLLRELRIPFRIIASKVPEDSSERDVRRMVLELAERKAESVAKKHPNTLVLGADTVVVCRGRVILKPRDSQDSLRILRELNGRWHRVYTGVALIDAASSKCWKAAAVSRVKARKLGEEELLRLAGKHMDKAGGYAVQDRQDPFIEKVVGPFDNVVGLPMDVVRALLRRVARRGRRGR